MLSKNQLRKGKLAIEEAAWQAYVTLLRFPVEMRPAFIATLDMVRGELSKSTGVREEMIYEEAEKIAERLGRFDLIDIKPVELKKDSNE